MSIENSIVFNFMKDVAPEKVTIECSTCQGDGEIDERLGGAPRSGIVDCPDCKGWGFHWSKQR